MGKKERKGKGRRTNVEKCKTGIAYQNKDIVSKFFAESLKEKSLNVYGLNVPKVVGVLPTNLPTVEANELRIDNIFLLEDGSYAIIDYESSYSFVNKLKYLGYVLRSLRKLVKEKIDLRQIKMRVIIIYTADVKRGTTEPILQIGALQLITEEAFLTDFDVENELRMISHKIQKRLEISETDMMKMIILPLAYPGKEKQRTVTNEIVELISQIPDQSKQRFLFAGILCFTDKIIDKEVAEDIRRKLDMTKVGRIIYEEKIAYGKEVEARVTKEVTKEVTKKVTERVTASQTEKAIAVIAELCKEMGASITDVVEQIALKFGLSEDEAKKKVEAYW